jgi:hypothetical protein
MPDRAKMETEKTDKYSPDEENVFKMKSGRLRADIPMANRGPVYSMGAL